LDDLIFRRNLLALSAKNSSLGDALLQAKPEPRFRVESSRTGRPVPVFQLETREVAFHSLVDPEREAARLARAQCAGGFMIALGLGAGYFIKACLASEATSAVVAVEYSAPLLRALLEAIDLSEIFLDPRFSLILDPTPRELEEAILSSYIPPISGDIRSLPLRSRTDLDPEKFTAAAEAIRSILGRISDDYSVQAFFGKLWFRNAVRNLFASERPSPPIAPVRRAIVTAAGPSLEDGIDAVVRAQQEGGFLVATDTSLPALLGRGILPGAVISIDCQAISYYHFLKGLPPELPLVLDLASPNRLARLTDNLRFFSSGHPFCSYVSANFRPFPALDTSGGNVTHAALSLAEALGAETCLLVGADFSYPEGKSYARGTYIYDYFDELATRFDPLESQFAAFVRRNTSISRETDVGADGRSYYRYVTKPLMAYREHLERFIERSAMEIRPLRGKGVEIRATSPAAKGPRRTRQLFSAGPASESAASFLAHYAAGLAALPCPREPAASYLRSLGPTERDLWTTLLPSASALQRSLGAASPRPAELLANVRSWALEVLSEALSDPACLE
jgi:hypothetical protein